MIGRLGKFLNTSVVKKQLVAVTGLLLVGFILGHLGGNFLIFVGPSAFNAYAAHIQGLGALLWLVRLGLLATVATHIVFTIKLTYENHAARGPRYAISSDFGETSFAKKTMIYSGGLIACFVLLHLSDFTFADKEGPASAVITSSGDPVNLGLYGLVWNSFLRPWRIVVYLVAVGLVGLHISHGIQSVIQTIGLPHDSYMPAITRASNAAGLLVALGFASIPVYVVVRHFTIGV